VLWTRLCLTGIGNEVRAEYEKVLYTFVIYGDTGN
jgi:hypothetical protein